MKKVIRNTFAQPISDLAKNVYMELLKKNEAAILAEADPKVTYVTDNNMNVVNFIALGGDLEKRNFGSEKFTFMGRTIELPYEKVTYNVVDMVTGNVTQQSARYLDTKDTEVVSEIYKEFYRLAEFLVTQEIAMKGLLPSLTEKGEFITDPRTGLALVGNQFLEGYFGLTYAANQDEVARAKLSADINRWTHASFLYQIKSQRDMWKAINKQFKTGAIEKFGTGPSLDNIGINDFSVSPSALTPESYITGSTTPLKNTFDLNNRRNYRSDLPNLMMSGNTLFNNGFSQPQPMVGIQPIQPNIQPSLNPVNQPVAGPIQPVTIPKTTNKNKK